MVGTQVFDGDKLPGVPENTVTLGLDYNQPLARGGWSVNYHLDGAFRDDTASNFNAISQFGRNFFEMDSFWIWNGSVTLDTDAWSVGLFVRNIADEEGITGGAGPGVVRQSRHLLQRDPPPDRRPVLQLSHTVR